MAKIKEVDMASGTLRYHGGDPKSGVTVDGDGHVQLKVGQTVTVVDKHGMMYTDMELTGMEENDGLNLQLDDSYNLKLADLQFVARVC